MSRIDKLAVPALASLGFLLLGACATPPANGRETREWLNLQKGGAAASAEPQGLTGDAADKVYQRYVDSFSHPLPEHFGREGFTGDGETNGGGGN